MNINKYNKQASKRPEYPDHNNDSKILSSAI